MHLLLIGDNHADMDVLKRIHRVATRDLGLSSAAAIQLGDFGFWQDYGGWKTIDRYKYHFPIPLYVVHGNHEDPEVARAVMSPTAHGIKNFHLFKEGGELVEITQGSETVRILACGGAACVDDPKVFFPFDSNDFLKARDLWQASGSPAIDLLVTHEAPSSVRIPGHPYFAAKLGKDIYDTGDATLDLLWKAVRPRYQVNGHHHKVHQVESACGLKHLTLPCAQEGFGVFDSETGRIDLVALFDRRTP